MADTEEIELRVHLLKDPNFIEAGLYNTFDNRLQPGVTNHFTEEEWVDMMDMVNFLWENRSGIGSTLYKTTCCLTITCCALPTCCLSCLLLVPCILHVTSNNRNNETNALTYINDYLNLEIKPRHPNLHFYAGYLIYNGEPFIHISSKPYNKAIDEESAVEDEENNANAPASSEKADEIDALGPDEKTADEGGDPNTSVRSQSSKEEEGEEQSASTQSLSVGGDEGDAELDLD